MLELLIMACCLALNALLSGMEMAFVSVGKPQLRALARSGNREATRILNLRDNPERTLSVLQVGITLVGVLAAAIGGAGAEESLSPILENRFALSENAAEVLTILAITLPYTYLTVVVGELVPKSIALRDPAKVILKASRWLALMDRVFAPVVNLLEASTKRVLQFFCVRSHRDAAPTSDEPLDLESLSQDHRQYVLNLFHIRKQAVRDVFVPWSKVVAVARSQPAAEVSATIHASGHTRLPVLDGGAVVGILNTKEFMALRATGAETWEGIVRPVVQLQESDSLIRALKLMQEKRSHLSIVLSGTRPIGIVTMEDVFEEIIGDIYDEDDDGRLRRLLISARRDRLPEWLRPHPPGAPAAKPSLDQ
ncbi:MAG: hemolysin family protein [Oligoflexia bacterium]|nr:hemolysin family protein [Oligoflexia bacterium]